MPPSQPFRRGPASKRRLAAFTLTELLVVLAVVALLVTLRLPALARVKTQTWITQCSGNLRQVGLSFLLYGYDNNGQLYSGGLGFWLWDLPTPVYQASSLYGVGKSNLFYCPSNPYQTSLWNFGGASYHVTGYAYTYPNSSLFTGSYATNANFSVTPPPLKIVGGPTIVLIPAKRVLVADAELCSGPGPYDPTQPLTTYNFTSIPGGAGPFPDGRYHRASHLAGKSPLGGNLGMLDGHVEWRPFRSPTYNMIQRNAAQAPNGTPCFLW